MKVARHGWLWLGCWLVLAASGCGGSNERERASAGSAGVSHAGASPNGGGDARPSGGAAGSPNGGAAGSPNGGAGAKATGGNANAGEQAGAGTSATGASSGGGAGGSAGGSATLGGAGAGGAGGSVGAVYDPDGVPAVLWMTVPSVPDPDAISREDAPGELRVITEHDGTHAAPSAFATLPAALETKMIVHVRGNSSSAFAKKSYALEFYDASGEQVKLPLLGMPKESDWVLHGPYSDKTYMRNALAYWLGREIYRGPDGKIAPGRWNPRTRFTEVYINARYWGVYVLVEKIKADADRVDVDRPAPTASGDVSGGYIIRREGAGDPSEGKDWVSSVDQLVYTHHYPRLEDLTVDQRTYIRDYFDDFEALMLSNDWNDVSTGYASRIDLESFLDYFLAIEWSNNVDGYFKSVYYVKHADSTGGSLSLGPLWDFDIAFGNANYRNGDDVEHWVHSTRGTEGTTYDPPGAVPFIAPYFAKLWTDPKFLLALRCRWQTLRTAPLASSSVSAKLDAWAGQLALAEKRDHQRWPVIGKSLWPNPIIWDTYQQEVSYLKTFTAQRFEFLDRELPKLAKGSCP